jgi:hypothetical protein
MKKSLQEQLDAVRRELEKQDEAWRSARDVLARLGDATQIPVPREVLELLEAPVASPTPPPVGSVRA